MEITQINRITKWLIFSSDFDFGPKFKSESKKEKEKFCFEGKVRI